MTEHTLMNTNDAMVWAEEFCRIFNGRLIITKDKPYGIGPGVDEGMMVGWFANAMGVGEMFYRQRRVVTAQSNEDGTVTLLGDLPDEVLISRELLEQMIDQHNQEVLRGQRT